MVTPSGRKANETDPVWSFVVLGFMGPCADADCGIAGGLDSQHVGHGVHCARYTSTTASGYTES